MINQILRFQDSVEAWGVSLPFAVQRHQRLKDIPKGGLKVLATISKRGCRFETFDPTGLWYYYGNNFFNCLTFKYRHGKQEPSSVYQHLNDHAKFLRLLGAGAGLEPLVELVSSIESMDHTAFYEELSRFLATQGYKGEVYVSLENDSLDNVVQCQSFMSAVNRRLQEIDAAATTAERLDVFGKPCDGYRKPLGDVQGLKLYSKNPDTKCYRRYGMNSAEACPIGVTSRTQIAGILQAILSPDNEATKNKPGLWYKVWIVKDQKGEKIDDFTVFTSIFPREDLIQCGVEKPVSQAEWQAKMASVIAALQNQAVVKPDFTGEVFIVQKTQGATALRYARTITVEELAQHTQAWQQGMFNSTGLPLEIFPPTLETVLFYMNSGWTRKSDKKGGFTLERYNLPFFTPNEVYEFFLGNPVTVRVFCDRFACYSVPSLMKDLYHCVSLVLIRNLIVHKLGILKEDFMNHWAFCLGRLFRLANYMYKRFFELRGAQVPRSLIGHRFYEMAYSNPARAYAEFGRMFATCLGYFLAEDEKPKGLATYTILTNRLCELVGESGLPEHPSTRDQILLQMGYSHFEKPPVQNGQDGDGQDGDDENQIDCNQNQGVVS